MSEICIHYFNLYFPSYCFSIFSSLFLSFTFPSVSFDFISYPFIKGCLFCLVIQGVSLHILDISLLLHRFHIFLPIYHLCFIEQNC